LALVLPVAAFFFAMGLYALAVPARVLAIFGVDVATPEGRTEVRAVYGGFGVAIGSILLVTLVADGIRDGVLVAVAVALFGMACGRLLSFAMAERTPMWPTWMFFGIELALAAFLVGAAVF
jgi:hypothetical protein